MNLARVLDIDIAEERVAGGNLEIEQGSVLKSRDEKSICKDPQSSQPLSTFMQSTSQLLFVRIIINIGNGVEFVYECSGVQPPHERLKDIWTDIFHSVNLRLSFNESTIERSLEHRRRVAGQCWYSSALCY